MTEDVRADLKAMDQEKEQLSRRIDKVQRKTENIPNRDKHLQMAAVFRNESEREAQLALQKQEQRTAVSVPPPLTAVIAMTVILLVSSRRTTPAAYSAGYRGGEIGGRVTPARRCHTQTRRRHSNSLLSRQ